MAKDIRPIEKVQIGHDGSGEGPGWYFDYVSIYVENLEEFYSFRNKQHRWVQGDNDLTLYKSGSDDCIDSFGGELKRFPKWVMTTNFFLGSKAGMNIRECKQACLNYDKNYCGGLYYYSGRDGVICQGFSLIEERYFQVKHKTWIGSVYLRKCKGDV